MHLHRRTIHFILDRYLSCFWKVDFAFTFHSTSFNSKKNIVEYSNKAWQYETLKLKLRLLIAKVTLSGFMVNITDYGHPIKAQIKDIWNLADVANRICFDRKVHIFWEGHKILWNLPLTFDCMYCSQKLGEDFAKFCGLLRIYEL